VTSLAASVKQAEQVLCETARSMGLAVCAERYGRKAIEIAPDFDGFEAWVETAKPAPVRARARLRFPHEEMVDATPETLCAAIALRCREGKVEIVAKLKETLARLEALP
jgi:hypothetical protein